jgi:hypothetical protein
MVLQTFDYKILRQHAALDGQLCYQRRLQNA